MSSYASKRNYLLTKADHIFSLKINFKLGGRSHHVQDLGVENGTMIMGADVTHVGKGQDDGCPSQAGVVATRDQHHIHYLASARLQTHNTEVCIKFLKPKTFTNKRD